MEPLNRVPKPHVLLHTTTPWNSIQAPGASGRCLGMGPWKAQGPAGPSSMKAPGLIQRCLGMDPLKGPGPRRANVCLQSYSEALLGKPLCQKPFWQLCPAPKAFSRGETQFAPFGSSKRRSLWRTTPVTPKSSRLGVILYWLRQRVWSVAPLADLPLQLSC